MDTRRLIIAMTLSFGIMYAYSYFLQRTPQPTATQPAATQVAAGTMPAGASAPQPAEATQPAWHARGADTVKQVMLGQNTEGKFYAQALLTSRGAAVEQVLLTAIKEQDGKTIYKYAETVKGEQPYHLLKPLSLPTGQTLYSWQVNSIRIGQPEVEVNLASVPWNVDEVTQTDEGAYVARFWVDVYNDQQPVVRIAKRYVLAPDSFAVDMDLSFEPLGQEEVRLIVDQLGPVGIKREDPRTDYRKVFVVTTDEDRLVPAHWTHADIVKKGTVTVGSASPIAWTALADKYFAAITAPVAKEGAPSPIFNTRVYASSQQKENADDLTMAMISAPVVVQPGQPAQLQYDLYVGPKDVEIFDANPQYAARQYVLLRSAEYAWCTFSSLGELMTSLLHWLNAWIPPHNYGVAIIVLVLLVRVILHPLTKHQQISMAQMQQKQAEVAPKIEALKQRYGNDRQQLQVEMMRVYREAGINPAAQMAGCLPMVIQLPIWVALYSALNNDINLWHEPFILWIRDLSAPDALYTFLHPIEVPILTWIMGPIASINVLPILLAVSMYLQQKLTPKPKPAPGTSPEQIAQQQQMQKMMGFMMIFMGLLFYSMPSGLNLYIMASSTFGILEQKRIRQHIEQRRNQPQAAKPQRRIAWLDSMFEKMEKKARDSHTLRKGKD